VITNCHLILTEKQELPWTIEGSDNSHKKV